MNKKVYILPKTFFVSDFYLLDSLVGFDFINGKLSYEHFFMNFITGNKLVMKGTKGNCSTFIELGENK